MKPKSARRRFRSQNNHLGFQIAPMIDVVFVILLFFVVAAGNARQESALNTVLPGGTHCGSSPDPVEIRIDESGQIYLNEEPLDSPMARRLPEFSRAIREIKNAGYDARSGAEIILSADKLTKYQRMVDVMDVLAREKITNVTFHSDSVE